jgi:DNA sulfur modification protein DndB
VFSARGAIEKTSQGWSLIPGSKLYILDGQHRSSAMSSALSHLRSQKETAEELGNQSEANRIQVYIDKLRAYPVAMQVYLELSQKEERQLFTDINTERKEAHMGLIMQYDHRDAYAELTRNVASLLQDQFEIEQKLSRLTNQNSAITSLPIIRRCLIALFEGILTVKKGDPNFRDFTPTEVNTISQSFFEVWLELFPRKMADRKRFVTGLTGIQIALAYAIYQLTKNYSITHLEAIQQLKVLKRHCSWRHDDPLFTQLYDPTTRKIKNHSSTTAIGNLAMIFVAIIEKEGMVVLDR